MTDNGPCNLVDDDLATRWSAEGDGEWAQLDLGVTTVFNQVQAAFYSGDERTNRFDVQVSDDGESWVDVLTGITSSGSRLDLETFGFADQNARYVRYVGHGNSINDWNSIAELRVVFEPSALTDGGNLGGDVDSGMYGDAGQSDAGAWADASTGNSLDACDDCAGGCSIGSSTSSSAIGRFLLIGVLCL